MTFTYRRRRFKNTPLATKLATRLIVDLKIPLTLEPMNYCIVRDYPACQLNRWGDYYPTWFLKTEGDCLDPTIRENGREINIPIGGYAPATFLARWPHLYMVRDYSGIAIQDGSAIPENPYSSETYIEPKPDY